MPTVYASPLGGPKPQFEDTAGLPATGYRLFFYVGGSVGTKQNTYTNQTGSVANTNPIVLNSLGQPATEIWLASGLYDVVYAPPGSDDPPTSPIFTVQNIRGINDTSVTVSQWVIGPAPTFVSGTSFTIAGDQTSTFHVGRRLQITDSVTTKYATITVSTYDGVSLTTITVVNDGAALVTPLASESYGLLTATNPSIPRFAVTAAALTMTTGRLLGRTTASTGAIEEITPGSGMTLAAGVLSNILRSYLAGCGISNGTDTTNDINVSAGQCTDSTNVFSIAVAAMAGKQLDAGWAPGAAAGMRNSAVAIADTTYHIYAVAKADGTQDIYAHTSTTVATVITALQAEAGGSAYLYARRIDSIVRAGATILQFVKDGDLTELVTPLLSVDVTAPGTSALTGTLNVPIGLNVRAKINMFLIAGAASPSGLYVSDLATADLAPSQTAAPLSQVSTFSPASSQQSSSTDVRTNTSAQVRYRVAASDGNTTVRIATLGWYDTRGRDA